MNARTNRWLVMGIGAALLAATGCDPYASATKGPPKVVRVLVFDSAPGDGQDAPNVVEAPDNTGLWLVNNADQGSYGYTYAFSARPGRRVGFAIEVQFNKPLDGATVQATAANCVPAAGSFVFPAVPNPPAPAPINAEAWYACYNPGNPDTTVGGTIIFYRSQTAPGSRLNDPRVAIYEPATNYVITGTVKDQQGNPVAINVGFNVSAEGMQPFNATNDGGYTLTANAGGTITVDWIGNEGGVPVGAQTYDILRAPNIVDPNEGDVPGAFAAIAGATAIPAATLTYTDTPGGAAGSKYWYRMTVHGTNGTTVTGGPSKVATLP